jgi:hypothetical protein
MYYKRPSFKRGGSTGIAQLTPRRQGYAGGGNIGGGTIAGSNLGTRTGFESINSSTGQPFPTQLLQLLHPRQTLSVFPKGLVLLLILLE